MSTNDPKIIRAAHHTDLKVLKDYLSFLQKEYSAATPETTYISATAVTEDLGRVEVALKDDAQDLRHFTPLASIHPIDLLRFASFEAAAEFLRVNRVRMEVYNPEIRSVRAFLDARMVAVKNAIDAPLYKSYI